MCHAIEPNPPAEAIIVVSVHLRVVVRRVDVDAFHASFDCFSDGIQHREIFAMDDGAVGFDTANRQPSLSSEIVALI